MIRRAIVGLGALVAAAHAWLLVSQALGGDLADPGLMARWLGAALLVAALAVLHRRGVSPRGRRAVALWVLATLLHAPALSDGHTPLLPAVPEVVASVLPAVATAAGLAALVLLVLAWWAVSHPARLAMRHALAVLPQGVAASPPGFLPRPPPLA